MALYNKYRPTNFDMVCGQEFVKKILTNQIKTGKLSNSYIFTGPAGTGKTTVARILAAMINAEKGPTINPQMNDPFVAEIMSGKGDIDVIEMDAATNGKIENIRDLVSKAAYSPTLMRKKIWIIDECHRLSAESWEGLLKLLEEPPEHAVFILCTTEVDKITETIMTRSMCLRFRPVTQQDVFNTLKTISAKENIDITEDAIRLITAASTGSLRMALSNLEKVSNLGEKITETEVMSCIGTASGTLIRKFMQTVTEKDFTSGLGASSELVGSGVDVKAFLEETANLLHCMAFCKKADLTSMGMSKEEAEAVKALRDKFTQNRKEITAKSTSSRDELALFQAMIQHVNRLHGYSIFNMQPQYLANLTWVTLYKEYIKP